MSTMPLVSVLIPCYNAGNYLHAAIQSILQQTHRNIEVIAIDDCSSDNTLQIIREYEAKDKRIRAFANSENIGLIKTLNKGIDLAKGDFVARMDQDDISLPKRIEMELAAMIEAPSLDIVACGSFIINSDGVKIYNKQTRTTSTKSNLFESFFAPPFTHPTVLFRASTLKKYYYCFSEITKHIEDYDLWSRMLMGGAQSKVIREVLFLYRDFSENTTHKYDGTQSQNMVTISLQNFENYFGFKIERDIQQIILNRQSVSISASDLNIAMQKLEEIRMLFMEKEKPSSLEKSEIADFLRIHKADILIQYFLKNRNRHSFLFYKHFSTIITPKVLYYVLLKLYIKAKSK